MNKPSKNAIPTAAGELCLLLETSHSHTAFSKQKQMSLHKYQKIMKAMILSHCGQISFPEEFFTSLPCQQKLVGTGSSHPFCLLVLLVLYVKFPQLILLCNYCGLCMSVCSYVCIWSFCKLSFNIWLLTPHLMTS